MKTSMVAKNEDRRTLATTRQQAAASPGLRSVGASGPEPPLHLAHDLRNWLTALQIYCDLLRTSGMVRGEGEKWTTELSHAVERGYGLVDSLLRQAQRTVAIPRSSTGEVGSESLILADALERRLPLLRQMAGSHIRVKIQTAEQHGAIALQEIEFERILLNLVRNAIDAMPDGGRLDIVTGYSNLSGWPAMILRISDSGIGIADEMLPYIFEPGISTKRAAAEPSQSRGFGLAIVRDLVRGAGGTVQVQARLGRGTSFVIGLPLLTDSRHSSGRDAQRRGPSLVHTKAKARHRTSVKRKTIRSGADNL